MSVPNKEVARGTRVDVRLVAIVTFDSGKSVEYTGKWEQGRSHLHSNVLSLFKNEVDKQVGEAAALTGVQITGITLIEETRTISTIERHYFKRQTVSLIDRLRQENYR